MATCDLGYEHEDQAVAEADAAPVVIESGPNEHDVEIAEIEAGAQVKVAEIYSKEEDQDLRAEVERLRGQVSGMQSVLDRVAPEPEPEPEPVAPEPAPVIVDTGEGEGTPPPPPTEGGTAKTKNGGGWWDSYR